MKINRLLYTGVLALATASVLGGCGALSRLGQSDGGLSSAASSTQQIMLIGSLGNGANNGMIQSYSINPHTLEAQHTASFNTPDPTFMALSSDRKRLYVTNEISANATLTALSVSQLSGELTMLNQTYTIGGQPTYVSVRNDKAITANYGGGSISLMYIQKDGSLGPADWQINLSNESKSQPHAAVLSQNGRDLYVPDLAQDKVFHFNIHTNVPPLTISTDYLELPKGSGPRHMVFDSKNRYAYLVCELTPTVYVLSYDSTKGSLNIIQEISTQGRGGKGGAHIALSKDGNYLYTSHRLNGDGIVTFKVNRSNGQLTYVGHTSTGKHPRQFVISPDDRYLAVACRDANAVEVYKRNPANGMLEKTALTIQTEKPVFILWEDFDR